MDTHLDVWLGSVSGPLQCCIFQQACELIRQIHYRPRIHAELRPTHSFQAHDRYVRCLSSIMYEVLMRKGVFEAGFYPSVAYYFASCYTRYDFGLRIGIFFGSYSVA